MFLGDTVENSFEAQLTLLTQLADRFRCSRSLLKKNRHLKVVVILEAAAIAVRKVNNCRKLSSGGVLVVYSWAALF